MASRCHEKLHGVNDTAEPDSGEVGTLVQYRNLRRLGSVPVQYRNLRHLGSVPVQYGNLRRLGSVRFLTLKVANQ